MRFLIFTVLFTNACFAQKSKQGVFVEGLGPGGYWSLNYQVEQGFAHGNWEARIGLSSYKFTNPEGQFRPDLSLPFGFAYRWNKLDRVKIGGGITLNSIQEYHNGLLQRQLNLGTFAGVGIQFIRKQHWFAEINGYWLTTSNSFSNLWGGCSLGYRF